jgi:hypothetical protein
MTKKLEDLFDLADFSNDDDLTPVATSSAEQQNQIEEINSAIDKIDRALPTVRNIESSDTEMDELAKLATDNFTELMALGMNVEPRHGAEIFSTASTLLGHAISAKNNKMTNKLKIIQLQIAKAKLDLAEKRTDGPVPLDGEAHELDRNAILAAVLEQNKKQQ